MKPEQLFRCLADRTRLEIILLLKSQDELCVCEIASALNQNQPKVSRHLALLRNIGVVSERRQGLWMFYRIHDDLLKWEKGVINEFYKANKQLLEVPLAELSQMQDRPERLVCT